MVSYNDLDCHVCGNRFTDDSDIVVCPVCGARHHRECYNEKGMCAFSDKHGTAEQWSRTAQLKAQARAQGERQRAQIKAEQQVSTETEQPVPSGDEPQQAASTETEQQPASAESEPQQADSEDEDTINCPACEHVNPKTSRFCSECGAHLHVPDGQSAGGDEPGFGRFPAGYKQDRFGGVSPDSEIDGVPVKDIADYVGVNSAYYIPRFKIMQENKRAISVNFCGLLLGPLWMFFRKMFKWAIPAGIIVFALMLPNNMLGLAETMKVYLENLTFDINIGEVNIPEIVAVMCQLLAVGVQFVSGLFGNKLYMRHVLGKIKRFKETVPDEESYKKTLVRDGKSNMGLAIMMYFLYNTASLAALIIFFAK